MTGLVVPGFQVLERLGCGPHGEVWAARELATGEVVALKRVAGFTDLAARDRLRREAAVLAGFHHPHVLRLRRVLGDGDAMVLVFDLASGGSLAGLMAARGSLAPGHVVTLAVPLAEALAAAHAQGLVHGGVTTTNVLFSADGRPMLSDLGLARLLGAPPGDDQGPADDVRGLAACCVTALTGVPTDDRDGRRLPTIRRTPDEVALLDVFEPALDTDPSQRPGAAELAVAAFDAATAQPLRLSGHVQWQADIRLGPSNRLQSPRSPRHRVDPTPGPPWRRGMAVVLAGGAVAVAAMTGITWAGADSESGAGKLRRAPERSSPLAARPSGAASASEASVSGAAVPTGWAATLGRLDDRRADAFAAGNPHLLAGLYITASPAGERDSALLQRLLDAGLRAEGVRLRAGQVTELERTGSETRLLVVDTMSPYRLVDERGHSVQRRPGRGPRTWVVTLRKVSRSWRIFDVVRR